MINESWREPDSYLRRMLHCGAWYNAGIQWALNYLPVSVLETVKERLVILSTGQQDGMRMSPALVQGRDVIVLSERILPKEGSKEDDPDVRYFIYVVLHEIAHAVKNHRPTSEVSDEEKDVEEAEADELAMKWFNDHVRNTPFPQLQPMTREEVETAQTRNKRIITDLHEGRIGWLAAKNPKSLKVKIEGQAP